MAKLAGLFAALSIGTVILRPELAQEASVVLFASTMGMTAALNRRRAYQAGNPVSS